MKTIKECDTIEEAIVLLENIISPIIMGIVYFGVFFSTGFLIKILAKIF